MKQCLINENSIGFLTCGDVNVKKTFKIIFQKEDGTQSNEQYYECELNPHLDEQRNNELIEEQLQNALDEYNRRVE